MTDLSLTFGYDLQVDSTGDLLTSDGAQEGQERVLRRLLTNPREYIWQSAYGAGLAQFLGQPVSVARIKAVILNQMKNEAIVSQQPGPVVTVTAQSDNSVFVSIQYVDSTTAQAVALSFPVG